MRPANKTPSSHARKPWMIFLGMVAWLAGPFWAVAAEAQLRLISPQDYQVFQRQTKTRGQITIDGSVAFGSAAQKSQQLRVEARLIEDPARLTEDSSWARLPFDARVRRFRHELSAPAGGWFQIEVRLVADEITVASATVNHVGVGEVFVIAGQSNAANHGETKQQTLSGKVSAFGGSTWGLANDPQPGASGGGGSFIPSFGDLLAARLGVPVGIASVAVGGTSVREWLPRGERMAAPPTTGSHAVTIAPETWLSTGELFDRLSERLRQLGPGGFRAVLWHQGESDNHQPPGHNITPAQYRAYLEHVIAASRKAPGWKMPWFVAQASYHTPDDPGSAELRAVQKAICRPRRMIFQGPNTDLLGAEFRDAGGRGVHFNERGLRRHGEMWAEVIGEFTQKRMGLSGPPVP